MTKAPALSLFCAALLLTGGCDILGPKGDTEIRAFTEQETRLAESSNAFGFDLLQQLNAGNEEDGWFISPLSISIALAMTLNGAEGNTLAEMREVLKVDDMSLPEMNEAYFSLIQLLRQLDPQVRFQIANSIWHDEQFAVLQEFIDTNRQYFDAEIAQLDFRDPKTVDIINAWVEKATNGLITEIIEEIGDLVVMYLINAIYFKGTWTYEFDAADTREEDFTTQSGHTVRIPLMNIANDFAYHADERVEVIDLPYGNERFSMTVVLPRPGIDINDVISELNGETWTSWTSNLDETTVRLHMPRFTFEYDSSLVQPLRSLGMVDAFVERMADFSGISPVDCCLYISDVLHKAFVEVNEEGTEAAAVTAVEMILTSGPSYIRMRVDRPFLFAIREHHGGTILFMGKITDPT